MHNQSPPRSREDGEAPSFVSRLQPKQFPDEDHLQAHQPRDPWSELARGTTGGLEIWDDEWRYPRLIIRGIERAAGMTTVENERHGPRIMRLIPFDEHQRQELQAARKAGSANPTNHQMAAV